MTLAPGYYGVVRSGMPKIRTSVALDPEIHDRLRGLSAEMPGLSMSEIMGGALEMYLPHLEAAAAAYRASPEDREDAAMEALLHSMMRAMKKGGASQ